MERVRKLLFLFVIFLFLILHFTKHRLEKCVWGFDGVMGVNQI